MTEPPQSPESAWSPVAVPDSAAAAPTPAAAPPAPPAGGAADRPEIPVGAAFAGGLLFALILKRLAR